MKNWLGLGFALGGLLLVAGCNSGGSGGGSGVERTVASAALVRLATCDDVGESVRSALLHEMNRRLDENLESALAGNGGCYYADAGVVYEEEDDSSGEPSSESTTNNQVDGVDEADFVKNEDGFLYVVSDGAFRIIDAWPAAQTHQIARVELPGVPKRLFISGDRALVYSSMPVTGEPPAGYPFIDVPQGECTYGYECDFTGDGNPTKITVLDIADRNAPTVVREIDLNGSYIQSRRIGDAVHTVVYNAVPAVEDIEYWPDNVSFCGSSILLDREVRAAFARLRSRNTKRIEALPVTSFLPSGNDVVHTESGTETMPDAFADCAGFYGSPLSDGAGFVTLLSMSMTDEEPLHTSTVVSRPGAVYASSDALYIAVRQQRDLGYGWYDSLQTIDEASTIHKFMLSNETAGSAYAASGVVAGRVLNQFAMDEHESHLRVATTSGYLPDPNVESALTVLEQRGTTLVESGKVDGIAPSEDIRSVRFEGERGFIVTFKKTDPLFVFDLSDPNAPRELGELEIPGFSTYMHMMDDTHLLTIGYDADDQGEFAWFAGVRLQIFDVTTPTDPRLLHHEVIGTRGSSSEALTNHLAFNYFAERNLLSFPLSICEGGSGGSYSTDLTFSGLMVYDVTLENGFEERGRIAHPTDVETGEYDSSLCSNWWTDASSEVKRSIIMDDFVFSISDDLIKVDSLDELGTDLVTLPIRD